MTSAFDLKRGMKLVIAALPASFLSACAMEAYDAGSLPMAQTNLSFALQICDAQASPSQSAGEFIECRLAAQQNFVADIKLKQQELFVNYAKRARLLAAVSDANKVSRDDFLKQYRNLVDELNGSIFHGPAVPDQ